VNGHPLTVIGVAPRGFSSMAFGVRPQVFVPLTLRWLMEPQRQVDAENRPVPARWPFEAPWARAARAASRSC
jgi:hypothetical protein